MTDEQAHASGDFVEELMALVLEQSAKEALAELAALGAEAPETLLEALKEEPPDASEV